MYIHDPVNYLFPSAGCSPPYTCTCTCTCILCPYTCIYMYTVLIYMYCTHKLILCGFIVCMVVLHPQKLTRVLHTCNQQQMCVVTKHDLSRLLELPCFLVTYSSQNITEVKDVIEKHYTIFTPAAFKLLF